MVDSEDKIAQISVAGNEVSSIPKVNFYHLTRSSLFEALPKLLEKLLQKNLKVELIHEDMTVLEALDKALWTYSPKSCLPHGMKGDPYPTQHPIWLTDQLTHLNGAHVLVYCSLSHPLKIKDCNHYVVFFDDQDSDIVNRTRAQWKVLKDEGYVLAYWKQNSQGKWEEQSSKIKTP